MEHVQHINCSQPFPPLTDEELSVFLKFQHSVGRILYFDKSGLDQHIILSPTFLINAFFSIIGDKRFSEGVKPTNKSLILMSQSGKIAKKSIHDIWQKTKIKTFRKHQEYLLRIMTHLYLLVEQPQFDKRQNLTEADFYFVTSMVENNDTTDYITSPSFIQRNIAFAFSPCSKIVKIPSDIAFRFVSYCLSIWAVKKYGPENNEMLFRGSAVFNINPSIDMYINCDDNIICIRLVHEKSRTLIDRDLLSSITKRFVVALENITQLYVQTSSTGHITYEGSLKMSVSCSSPNDPCLLLMSALKEQDGSWICPKHSIKHSEDILSSWTLQEVFTDTINVQ